MRRFLILLSILGCCNILQAQHTGYVFWDNNKNGQRDHNESGVKNAVVSDGYHVVRTNANGRFKLKGYNKQRFITLYPGADFSCSQRFIPIKSATKTYSFAVTPKEKKEKVSFVQISDTETFEFRDWVDQLKQYAQVHQPDFIMHTGDICYRSGMAWHAENVTQKQLKVPVFYCLGNHDLIKGEYGEQFFEKCFGPAWYAFEESNTLFVVTPMMGGDYKPSFTHEDIGGWLKNLLKTYDRKQPKVFFNHDLLTNGDQFTYKRKAKDLINLNDYNLKAWLYGHWHINMVKKHGDSGVTSYSTSTLASGGIDHSPSGFRVVDVDKNGNTTSHFRWTYLDRELEITSPQKKVAILNENGEIDLSINTYHTGAQVDSVKYALWGEEGFNWNSSLQKSKWKQMNQESDWTWSASIKAWDQQQYELVVNAYLKSGEVLHAKRKFTTLEKGKEESVNAIWHNLAGNKEHNPVIPQNHHLPYQLSWSANLGSNIFMSSPVLHKNNVLSSSFDDGNAEKCHIVCWDATTGSERWRYKTLNGVKNQMVIAQGLVIATDMQGMTYAIDIKTGKLQWEKNLEYNRLPAFITGLVTDGEVVYTGFGASLCTLDALSGKVIWKNTDWKGGNGTTPTMTIADNLLIASNQWGAIYAHDTRTGKLLWSRKDEGLRFRDGVVSYKEGNLWVAERSQQNIGNGILHRLDLKSGKTIERINTEMYNTGTSAPVILRDKVIVAGSHPGIAAFDKKSKTRIWQFEVGPSLLYTPSYFADGEQSIESTPLCIGEKIVFGAMDGVLYVLNEKTGQLLWKTKLGAPILTTVAAAKDRIYVCDFAGNIYCFTESK